MNVPVVPAFQFQSSPAPKSGRYPHRSAYGIKRRVVSILARSEERALRERLETIPGVLQVSILARSEERALHFNQGVWKKGADVSILARSEERALHRCPGTANIDSCVSILARSEERALQYIV